MMVIANCVAAIQQGMVFVDATLAGLGRSAGNAPTEILVAVCRKLGIDTGIDLFELMDMIETCLWPVASRIRPHDMMGVRLTLRVNPEIAELLHGEENYLIASLERKIGKQIVVYPNPDFHIEQFDIFETLK